jgi:diguanylate cyclase (GGDEF)-like protein/PAS domain S-box-containing protein
MDVLPEPLAAPASLEPDAFLAFGEMVRALSHAASEAEILRIVAEGIGCIVPADSAGVALVTPSGEEVEVLALAGRAGAVPLGRTLPLGRTGVPAAVARGTAWSRPADEIEDLEDEALIAGRGIATIADAPLETSDGALGTLTVGSTRPGAYGAEELAVLETVADAVGAVIERRRLLDRAKDEAASSMRRAERASVVGVIGQELAGAHTGEDVFRVMASAAGRILDIVSVSYAVRTTDPDFARLIAIAGGDGTRAPGLGIGLPGTAIGRVLDTGVPVVAWNLPASPWGEHAALAAAGALAVAHVPVATGDAVTGVLNVCTSRDESWSPDTIALLEAFGQLMGTTLERVRAQEDLAASERRTRALIDDSPLMIVALDGDGRIRRVSRFAASKLGYRGDELVGTAFAELHPVDDRAETRRRVERLVLAGGDEVSVSEVRMLRRDGGPVWARQTGRVLRGGDGAGEVVIVCEDITEVRALAERVEHQATHDALTGLVNRAEFDRRVQQALARAREDGTPACLCFLDLDHFKVINDTCGHRAGDAMLRELVERLGACVAAGDTLARFGGDEFAVLLGGCGLPDALRVADRLRVAVEEFSFTWEGRTFGVSLSVGVAEVDPAAHHDAGQLLADVDAACYSAKNAGRNRVAIAHADAESLAARRSEAEWVARTRSALAEDRFELFAQPIVPVRGDDDRLRFEVLIRMREGDELVSPGAFIPAAERFGLAGQIDEWVLRRTVGRLAAEPAVLERIDYCTLNVSARSIESEEFLGVVLGLLGEHPEIGRRVCFEVTETAAMSQMSTALRFIEAVKALGCRIALDDFGNGFASFGYLRQIPLDFLKIDGTLVRDVVSDPIDRAVVRAVHDMAEAVGLGTIAEFVEDPAIMARLEQIGVDYAQGFGIGRPRPIDEILLG